MLQGQTSYYRNSHVGQWRYYPLTKDMTPKTIDWDMFLGHKFKIVDGAAARADAEGDAVRPGRVRRSGAATGRSAAACSPTCSSTRRRT